MKVAFKLSYIGKNYFGMQRQKDKKTIQGEIERALRNLGILSDMDSIQYGGRTDRGVNAIGQVISFNVDDDKASLCRPSILNSKLYTDICLWAYSIVDYSFNPRKDAIQRHYKQIIPKKIDVSAVDDAVDLLIGRHDFTNFTKKDRYKKSNVRRIDDIKIRSFDYYSTIDIFADSFTWNMARKISNAILMISDGTKDLGWFKEILNNEKDESVSPLSSYGLILMDIMYDKRIDFKEDEYSKKRFLNNLSRLHADYLTAWASISKIDDYLAGTNKRDAEDGESGSYS